MKHFLHYLPLFFVLQAYASQPTIYDAINSHDLELLKNIVSTATDKKTLLNPVASQPPLFYILSEIMESDNRLAVNPWALQMLHYLIEEGSPLVWKTEDKTAMMEYPALPTFFMQSSYTIAVSPQTDQITNGIKELIDDILIRSTFDEQQSIRKYENGKITWELPLIFTAFYTALTGNDNNGYFQHEIIEYLIEKAPKKNLLTTTFRRNEIVKDTIQSTTLDLFSFATVPLTRNPFNLHVEMSNEEGFGKKMVVTEAAHEAILWLLKQKNIDPFKIFSNEKNEFKPYTFWLAEVAKEMNYTIDKDSKGRENVAVIADIAFKLKEAHPDAHEKLANILNTKLSSGEYAFPEIGGIAGFNTLIDLGANKIEKGYFKEALKYAQSKLITEDKTQIDRLKKLAHDTSIKSSPNLNTELTNLAESLKALKNNLVV